MPLPAPSLRSSLHTLPAFRPPQAAANFSQSCFVGHFPRIHPNPSHSSAPRLHAVFRSYFTSHRVAAPRAASGRYGIKRCPRHSRRFRTPTVVCAAWSFLRDRLTPLPPAAGAAIVCFSKNKTFPNSRRQLSAAKDGSGATPWVSVVVGPGKHHSNPPDPGGDHSNRNPLPRAKPSPSPSLGSFGSVIANAPPPLIAPPTEKEGQEAFDSWARRASRVSAIRC